MSERFINHDIFLIIITSFLSFFLLHFWPFSMSSSFAQFVRIFFLQMNSHLMQVPVVMGKKLNRFMLKMESKDVSLSGMKNVWECVTPNYITPISCEFQRWELWSECFFFSFKSCNWNVIMICLCFQVIFKFDSVCHKNGCCWPQWSSQRRGIARTLSSTLTNTNTSVSRWQKRATTNIFKNSNPKTYTLSLIL